MSAATERLERERFREYADEVAKLRAERDGLVVELQDLRAALVKLKQTDDALGVPWTDDDNELWIGERFTHAIDEAIALVPDDNWGLS